MWHCGKYPSLHRGTQELESLWLLCAQEAFTWFPEEAGGRGEGEPKLHSPPAPPPCRPGLPSALWLLLIGTPVTYLHQVMGCREGPCQGLADRLPVLGLWSPEPQAK